MSQTENTNQTDVTETSAHAIVRNLRGMAQLVIAGFSVALALFHIYANVIGLSDLRWLPATHFAGFALLCAVRYPLLPRLANTPLILAFDLAFGLLVMGATLYIVGSEDAIYAQGVKLSTSHWIATFITVFGAIELTRRTTGYIIPVIILISLIYATPLGAYVPGVLKFSGLSYETIAFRSIFADEGMFGIIGRISATFVFMFILFGAFLVRSGAGDFIIDLARVAAGRFVGGPGFVAIFASGLTGTISGSAVANTVSTGVITIPLMKKSGFDPRFAAGVEAASSTGGQVMPPIMGAGAFVMASNTQIPYLDIVAVSLLPALVYFLSVAFFVRIEAKKHDLTEGAQSSETLMSVLRRGGPAFLIPIITLIGLLIAGFTPVYAAGWAILSVIASSWLTPNKMGPRAIWDSLVMGTQNMIMTAVLLVAIGLMVNVIAMTGIGNTFSLMMADWAGGNLIIAIVLVALASLVLGMGLPVTAAYIVLATLSAPALQALIQNGFLIDLLVSGNLPESAKAPFMLANPEALTLLGAPMSVDAANALIASAPSEILSLVYPSALDPALITAALLSAHMIIFWLSQDSNVTPPVCLTAFAAATIAGTPPMSTGVKAWKLAKGLYLMPVLFAYTAFLYGSTSDIILIFISATVAVYAFGAAMEGHMEAPLNWPLRIVVAIAGGVLLWPGIPLWSALAFTIIVAVIALNIRQDHQIRLSRASA